MEEPPTVSLRRAAMSALFILFLSGLFATAANLLRDRSMDVFSPLPPLGVGDIGLLEARQLIGEPDVAFLDARSEEAYRSAHIPGSINVPHDRFYQLYPQLEERLRARTLITYCSSPRCTKGDIVSSYLTEKGNQDVRVMRPGFSAWFNSQLPMESGL